MKINKIVVISVIIIALLSGISSFVGIKAWPTVKTHASYVSPRGDTTRMLTTGVYKHNPNWFVAEGVAWDYVTFFFAIPLLLAGLFLYIKGSMKGAIILVGMFVYFAYTYLLYSTGWAFNELFLCYTSIITLSICGLFLLTHNLDFSNRFNFEESRIPFRAIAVFCLVIGLFIGKMWVGLVLDMIRKGNSHVPEAFAGVNSLVVQAYDLSLIVPLALITGILLFKKVKTGVLFSFVVIVKGLVMALAITVMVILKGKLTGNMPYSELIPFIVFFIVAAFFFVMVMKDKMLNN